MKPGRYIFLAPSCGLEAVLYVDSLVLGPAVGGVRTSAYDSLDAAIDDAAKLARAMTVKCALAGLAAGGCKVVVRDGPTLDRARAFAQLGKFLADFGDNLHVGADLGTSQQDIADIAKHFSHVHAADGELTGAAGAGVLRCIEACARLANRPLGGLRAAVQGVGVMGAAVVRALHDAGLELFVADLVEERARELARGLGLRTASADEVLELDVDVLVPCARGGVIDEELATRVKAWAVCGAANNICETAEAERILASRGVVVVPDVISSAGAVTQGVATSLMGIDDATPLIDRLGEVAEDILRESMSSRRIPTQVAHERARALVTGAIRG